ncbi:hypothetical protein AMQ83_36090 [Paenibacillus riograndensis]|nr:hypothetical protein AMQ83_36090 [Paenibacillus riograndensis]
MILKHNKVEAILPQSKTNSNEAIALYGEIKGTFTSHFALESTFGEIKGTFTSHSALGPSFGEINTNLTSMISLTLSAYHALQVNVSKLLQVALSHSVVVSPVAVGDGSGLGEASAPAPGGLLAAAPEAGCRTSLYSRAMTMSPAASFAPASSCTVTSYADASGTAPEAPGASGAVPPAAGEGVAAPAFPPAAPWVTATAAAPP